MAECISPFALKDQPGVSVPCGKCVPCKKRRVSGWSFRLMKEAEVSTSAYFITLTYDTDHVPVTDNGFMTLVKRDLQMFFKRLRYNSGVKGIKYYAVGEYGSDFQRPHYHVILFNCPLSSLIGSDYERQYEYGNLLLDGKTPYYCDSWTDSKNRFDRGNYIGHITVGMLTVQSVGYTLKYVSKDSAVGKFQRDDRLKEFSLMSKKMGASYLDDDQLHWHKADILNRMYCVVELDKKIAMPRYYKGKIYSDYQRQRISLALQTKRDRERSILRKKDIDIIDLRNENIRRYFARRNGQDERFTSL